MRVVFAGSPDIAVPSLLALAKKHEVVAVLTNPPSPQGRKLKLASTAVAEAAQSLGLKVMAPERLGPEERAAISLLRPELLVVFAYGKIFGPKFLSLFPRGGINAHPSLLPRWRGCAPIPMAILAGDKKTGLCIQKIASKMDAGDILAREEIPLLGMETAESLSVDAAELGARLLLDTIEKLEAGSEKAEAQTEEGASYCYILSKNAGCLDWHLSAMELDARIRAFYPWPGTYTTLLGERLLLLEARPHTEKESGKEPGTVISIDKSEGIMVQTGKGQIAIRRLQLCGKKPMDYKAFANGARGLEGSVLGL